LSDASISAPPSREQDSPVATPVTTPVTTPAFSRKKSSESMVIDVDDDISSSPTGEESSQGSRFILDEPDETSPTQEIGKALTTTEFNYSIKVLDRKINSLYKLCRFTADQQQEMAKSIKKLVALDDLSEDFLNVSYLI
jgi:nitric oxide reductase activation protein